MSRISRRSFDGEGRNAAHDKVARIEENLGAADVALTPYELAAIEAELATITIHGNRTDEDIQRMGYVKAQ